MAKGIYPPSVQPGKPALPPRPEGWSSKKFGDVLREVSRPIKLKDNEEYQLVVAKRSRGGIEARERLPGSKIKTPTQFKIETGDFLISKRQIVHGACGLVPPTLDGAIVSNEYAVLHPTEELDLGFLNHYSHTTYFQQTCFHSSVGVDVEKMIFRLHEWFRHEVWLPPVSEQMKIAEVLSTWDQAISDAGDLIKKKAKEIEHRIHATLTSQNIKFKKIPIENVGEIVSGGTPATDKAELWDGGIFWVTPTDITKLKNKYVLETVRTLSETGLKESSAKLLPPGSIVVCTRATIGEVAITAAPMTTNQGFKNIIPDERFDSLYLYYAIRAVKSEMMRLAAGSTFLELSKKDFSTIKISVPELWHQKGIGKFCDSLEREIEVLAQGLQLLKKQKQGLMQKLLTGRLRVSS